MRVGVDVGGTFTDLVAEVDGRVVVAKITSTPDDPARALAEAVHRVGPPSELLHGTTVATNAVLTRTGACLALVTTEGFRHLLHLARQDRPSLYDLRARPPEPLVARDRCVGVPERTSADGTVLHPLDEDALRALLRDLGPDVDGVAVVLLHAYASPDHERRVGEIVAEERPDVAVSLSSDVLPEFREFERASTTVLNAYVQPAVSGYLARIRAVADDARIGVMWSGGGVRSLDRTIERPVHTLLSGPAAGVLAAAWVGERCGVRDLVTLDMGGTSADVALVEDGTPLVAEGSSLDGLPFRTPCLDVVSVGAGGGSIGWVDEGGALRVGPRSAGADPGPAAYGRGGTEATVTDAQVALGLLGGGLAGGELELDVDAACAAVDELGVACGLDRLATADGILRVVRATMGRAIRSVTIERGKDVRRYTLVAFGGAGPLHATALARELGIASVVVPPAPGALAALGLLVASRRADASRTRPMAAEATNDADLRSVLDELVEDVVAALDGEGISRDETTIDLSCDCRYVGQSHEIRIACESGFAAMGSAFHAAHRERFGFERPDAAVEAVTFRAAAFGPARTVDLNAPRPGAMPEPSDRRRIGPDVVPVFERAELPLDAVVSGPAIVSELDSTTYLDAASSATVHPSGALIVDVA